MKNNNVLNDIVLRNHGINSIPSFLRIKLLKLEQTFLTYPSLPTLKDDFNVQDFTKFYLVLHEEINTIMLDVHFKRLHWYTIYNHKKFHPVLFYDNVVRLVPLLICK